MGGEVPERLVWWEWELAFTSHLEDRMEQRVFSEVELRTILDDAKEITPRPAPGALDCVDTLQGQSWAVIVEPDEQAEVLIVVTAYPIGRSL